jgi:hypothetical protein
MTSGRPDIRAAVFIPGRAEGRKQKRQPVGCLFSWLACCCWRALCELALSWLAICWLALASGPFLNQDLGSSQKGFKRKFNKII